LKEFVDEEVDKLGGESKICDAGGMVPALLAYRFLGIPRLVAVFPTLVCVRFDGSPAERSGTITSFHRSF
jgi:hypothetical protein